MRVPGRRNYIAGDNILLLAPKVLVIEDDGGDQRKLVQTLSAVGYHVDVAANGEQALQHAANLRYDAITLDLLLPDRSGLEVLAKLRSSGDNRDVRVVVVTMVTETSVLAGFQISDVLTKPIRPGDVVTPLRRACRNDASFAVLVVDDDASALDLMATILRSAGMRTVRARPMPHEHAGPPQERIPECAARRYSDDRPARAQHEVAAETQTARQQAVKSRIAGRNPIRRITYWNGVSNK